MAKTRSELDALLDHLEADLPNMILKHPDADGADFWMAFARRSASIERFVVAAHKAHFRARVDSMLRLRGLDGDPVPGPDDPVRINAAGPGSDIETAVA